MSMQAYDVVVAGGGLAGCFAAVAAARAGARVALFEQYGFLGGMATAAPVAVFMQYHVARPDGSIGALVEGLFAEMVRRLRASGDMLETPFSFDDFGLRGVLDDLMVEAGVEVCFHTFVAGAHVEGSRLAALQFASKAGLQTVAGAVFVDATGDGDLAALAGAPFDIGREDGRMQPLTPTFVIGGIDATQDLSRSAVNALLKAAHARGESATAGLGFWRLPQPDQVFVNMPHVWNASPLDVGAMSRAEMEGRRQIRRIMDDLRRHVPAFARAHVVRAGVQIGVRETRHLRGRYRLTVEDVLAGRRFDDGIARCAYEVDIHALKPGETTFHAVLERGRFYEIPYRCLLPEAGPANLLVACRALSATHEAHGSLRIMPTMAAVGEAAGLAAAQALVLDGDAGRVDGAALKRTLIERRIMGDPFGGLKRDA